MFIITLFFSFIVISIFGSIYETKLAAEQLKVLKMILEKLEDNK